MTTDILFLDKDDTLGRGTETFWLILSCSCIFAITKREMEGLIEAMKAFGLERGTIITMNQEETFGNIKVVPVWKWL